MAAKRKHETNKSQRLAKGPRTNPKRSGAGRTRENPLRAQSGGNTGRAVADERNLPAFFRLVGALRAENIRFQLIGMSAAVLQGVPVVTHDVDMWIDLPPRQYMSAVNVALRHGAKMIRNTVVELSDGMLVNFIYEVTGLGGFAAELRKARKLKFYGCEIPVMPLESIRKSKAAVMRDKDPAHIHYIDETLRLRRAAK
ncbi:MAG: hypothetical protein V9H26_19405 [Verrucomicrobiota bacterium]